MDYFISVCGLFDHVLNALIEQPYFFLFFSLLVFVLLLSFILYIARGLKSYIFF